MIPLPLLPQTQTTEIYLAFSSSEQRQVLILPRGIRCKLHPQETSQLETQGVRGEGEVQDEKTPLSDVEHTGLPWRASGGKLFGDSASLEKAQSHISMNNVNKGHSILTQRPHKQS